MAKKEERVEFLHGLFQLIVGLTGLLVSLAVGFGMADGVLGVRFIPVAVTAVAGWVVIVMTIVSAILYFFENS